MGVEATCAVTCGKRTCEGRALLETTEILFRGEIPLRIPFASITKVEARRGKLHVTFPGGPAVFDLGPKADQWFIKIRYPKPLMDKLGVKPEIRVGVAGMKDPDFLAELKTRVSKIATTECDVLFLSAETPAALDKLVVLQKRIKRNGAIWVIYPKAQKHITENGVRNAGLASGLVDVKVASISPTHTGLKFVIPVAQR